MGKVTFKDLLILSILVCVLFGASLGQYPIEAPDGARYAEIPREMLVTGDYLTPYLNGIKYFEKPPLFYWLQTISLKTLGINELAANLINAIMGGIGCITVYLAACVLYNRRTALIASAVLATNVLYFAMTRVVTLDLTLTTFITICLVAFIIGTKEPPGNKRRCYFWAAYTSAALATMTKGLAGLFLPGLIILIWVVIYNDWRNIKHYYLASGGFLFLLITVPWHILVQLKNPEFFHFYFIEQHFLRYLTPYAGRTKDWWFFPIVLLCGLYPWTTIAIQSIYNNFPRTKQQLHQYKDQVFLLIWLLTIYIFYSLSDSKLIPYLLPMLPPISILIGYHCANQLEKTENKQLQFGMYSIMLSNLLLGIGLMIANNHIDFQKQLITPQHLYYSASLLCINSLITFIVTKYRGLKIGFITLVITSACFLISLNPITTVINNKSIKVFVPILQQYLTPRDEVICFGDYYQDLPFYLQRRVVIANTLSELAHGIKHQNTQDWIIDTNTFWQHWQRPQHRAFMLTTTDNYYKLLQHPHHNMHLIYQHTDKVLVSNFDNHNISNAKRLQFKQIP